jgi:hypothetical protein
MITCFLPELNKPPLRQLTKIIMIINVTQGPEKNSVFFSCLSEVMTEHTTLNT